MSVPRSRPARRTFRLSRHLALPAFVVLAALGGCGKQEKTDPETTARLIQPVARVVLKVEKAAPGKRSGEQVYEAICAACHASGVLGAPKTGDAAAWGPRIAQGFDTLTRHAIEGIRQMPPRGGGADLTDVEVRRAVAYLADKAGADFKEPPQEP